jgi:hypothetical protein
VAAARADIKIADRISTVKIAVYPAGDDGNGCPLTRIMPAEYTTSSRADTAYSILTKAMIAFIGFIWIS